MPFLLTLGYHFQVINIVAGSLAGALTAVFVCPLDVLKTRLQVQGKQAADPKYRSIHGELILAYWSLLGLICALTSIYCVNYPWKQVMQVIEMNKPSCRSSVEDSRTILACSSMTPEGTSCNSISFYLIVEASSNKLSPLLDNYTSSLISGCLGQAHSLTFCWWESRLTIITGESGKKFSIALTSLIQYRQVWLQYRLLDGL